MSIFVTTTNDIYDLVQDLLDGDEFQSDDAAQRSMNTNYRKILADRDWYFLIRTTTMQLDSLIYSALPNFDKVLNVYHVDTAGTVNPTPLRKAMYSDRFNTEYDYYISEATGEIILINELTGSLLVDYKFRPNDLGFTAVPYSEGPPVVNGIDDTPIIPVTFRPLLALGMVHDFKKSDEAEEMFRAHGLDEESLFNAMIDDDNDHKEFYA